MRFIISKFALFHLIFAVVFVSFAADAKAATFPVTNSNDSGAGSLRQAILDADNSVGADVIEFQNNTSGAINLLSALPDLSGDVTVNGISAESSVIRRNSSDLFRIFKVAAGAVVTLNNLTLQKGQAPYVLDGEYSSSIGGGILNLGNLIVRNCKIMDNKAAASMTSGGGVYNKGNLIVEKTVFLNNQLYNIAGTCPSCYSHGAAVYNAGTVMIDESQISGSSGSTAIYNDRFNQITISDSKISVNLDGGIYSDGGSLKLEGSAVINNLRTSYIGSSPEVTMLGGTLIIENSTISGNIGSGSAGVSSSAGTLRLINNTITNNQGNQNGGLGFANCRQDCKIIDNIIAGNKATSTSTPDVAGFAGSQSGFNLIGNGTGGDFVDGANGNIVGTAAAPVDPQLSPLGDYGGKTPTHKLLSSSPAINRAHPSEFSATDQRGVLRPVGSAADIGAFEFNLTPHRALPNGGLNAVYTQNLAAFADDPQAKFSFDLSAGELPRGLSLVQQTDTTAVISGIPQEVGTYNFTITATNHENLTISADYVLTIRDSVSFAAVGGKVLSARGRGVSKAFVLIFDSNGNIINRTITNPFGYFHFAAVQTAEIYTFRIVSKNRQFSPQTVIINDDPADLIFTADLMF